MPDTPNTKIHPPTLGMILKGFPRISETFISNEILLLEQHGFKVHIFSMRQPRETFSHASVKQIRAQVDYLPSEIMPALGRLLWSNAQLAVRNPRRYLQAAGMAARRFRRTRKSATLKHLLQAGYLVQRLLSGTGVVHFHAHFAHSPTSVALFAGCLSGLPFSFTAHAKDIYTSDPRQLREKIEAARFVITCTDYNQQYLKGLGAGGHTPIRRAYHGINLDLFVPRASAQEPSPPYRLLTIARMAPKKGWPTVLKAVRLLVDKGIELKYTLIGDGEERQRILSLIQELNLGPVTQWLGTLPHENVIEHFETADLFVLGCEIATNGDRDGIPNVLIESMAMGVPVVSTRISAIPELVHDGETGLLVPSKAPESMAAAIQTLLTDPGLRQRIIVDARRRVTREFDNKALAAELAAYFRKSIPELDKTLCISS